MDEKLQSIRHSTSHVLAQAVLELYPDAKLAIGPPIEDGFYYDFDLGGKTFSEDDLAKLEKKMKHIIKQNQTFTQSEMDIDEAIKELKRKKQPYKVDLAEEFKKRGDKKVGFNTMALGKDEKFTDLCAGGHIESTKEIGAVKLLKVAGAYWRGDEKNKMLQRIYGTAFKNEADLKEYLDRLKLAEERDHRKLGQELDLFTFSDLVGGGLPMFTDKGTIIRNEIEDYLSELQIVRGYQKVWSPHVANKKLYQTSGHWDKFSDDNFVVQGKDDNDTFVLKPMNCPHHTQIYSSRQRSYRDLPLRYFEVSTVYRNEKVGQLHGLTRVRSITQDDAHIFCRPDQIEDEANLIYDIIEEFYKTFGMELVPRLSLSDPAQPDKYLGDRKVWENAENALRNILKKRVSSFEEEEGEAAFYGPKIDFEMKDAIGRKWQVATIQLDFNQPERFELEYIDESGERVRPVMIHRAVSGAIERFMGIIIEHYGGAFPTWLSPVQVSIVAVSDQYNDRAYNLANELQLAGVRVEVDDSSETVGNKIRKASGQKIPYMLVFGEKEASGKKLTVRKRGSRDMEEVDKKKFIEHIQKEISSRA